MAKDNHKRAGVKNAKVIHGNGTIGLPDKAPFDRIMVTVACEIDDSIFDQLVEDGFLLAPVGESVQSDTLQKN